MASIDKVKSAIADIAQRRKNVTIEEINWVADQLRMHGFKVREPRKAKHGYLYGIGSQRFMVNSHNPGSKQVKSYSVDAFISGMIELGLYEE
jgi:hypothetical protein